MIKVLYLVRRAAGLTHDEFLRYQIEHHAPLALRHHPAMIRYVTNPVVQEGDGSGDIDTIAELWFGSREDLHRERFYDSLEGRSIISADARKFCAPGTRRYITEEIVIKDDLSGLRGVNSGRTV